MIRFIQNVSRSKTFWALLFLLGIILEGCALYFQYGLRLAPCVNCVYERAYILGFILAGLLGFLFARNIIARFVCILIFLLCSIGGVNTALTHLEQASAIFATCKLRASFPEFFKLDEWLPWMFKPFGSCSDIDWQFLGFSMPQWILTIFLCGLVVSAIFLIAMFFRTKKDYIKLYTK